MTMAKNLNAWLNLNQPLFGIRQKKTAGQQKAGDGLHMATAQEAPRSKFNVTLQI